MHKYVRAKLLEAISQKLAEDIPLDKIEEALLARERHRIHLDDWDNDRYAAQLSVRECEIRQVRGEEIEQKSRWGKERMAPKPPAE